MPRALCIVAGYISLMIRLTGLEAREERRGGVLSADVSRETPSLALALALALAPSASRHLLVLLFQGTPIRSTLSRPFFFRPFLYRLWVFPVSPQHSALVCLHKI